MKRLLAFCLCFLFLALTGCSSQQPSSGAAEYLPADDAVLENETAEEILPTPCDFTVDDCLLPADTEAYLAGCEEDWAALIGGVLAGEEPGSVTVVVTDAACAQRVTSVFAHTPYAAYTDVLVSDNTMEVSYTGTGSAEALHDAVSDLVEGAVYQESNPFEIAVSLYRAVASGCTFEESEENSLYRMLVEKKGGTAEFAAALQYLLAQNGIPAWIASGTDGDAEHQWVIAELNGQLYHFDPVMESTATNGLGLRFFAMSDAAHIAAGCGEQYTIGFAELAETQTSLCPDETYDAVFSDVTGWECDVINHYIYLSYDFETDFLNSVSTETGTAAAG